MADAERILNEYEAWRRETLASGPDVSTGAYLSHLRVQLLHDLCEDLYNALIDDEIQHGDWLATLQEAGFRNG